MRAKRPSLLMDDEREDACDEVRAKLANLYASRARAGLPLFEEDRGRMHKRPLQKDRPAAPAGV